MLFETALHLSGHLQLLGSVVYGFDCLKIGVHCQDSGVAQSFYGAK